MAGKTLIMETITANRIDVMKMLLASEADEDKVGGQDGLRGVPAQFIAGVVVVTISKLEYCDDGFM